MKSKKKKGGEVKMREEPAGVDTECYVSVGVSQSAAAQHVPTAGERPNLTWDPVSNSDFHFGSSQKTTK